MFKYTKPLSIYLQKQNIELCDAINHIDIIIKELISIRENAETVFNDLFVIIVTQSVYRNYKGIEIKIPRQARDKNTNAI